MALTWRFPSYWLGYIVTENSMHTVEGEDKSTVLSNSEACVC